MYYDYVTKRTPWRVRPRTGSSARRGCRRQSTQPWQRPATSAGAPWTWPPPTCARPSSPRCGNASSWASWAFWARISYCRVSARYKPVWPPAERQ